MEKKNYIISESLIKQELDKAYKGQPSLNSSKGNVGDIKYNFFLDLEEGYTIIAGSKIHLFGDGKRWAVVFEVNGYHTRGERSEISLIYVGNCIDYVVNKQNGHTYVSNMKRITLISSKEFKRIENKEGIEMETFELIGADIKEVEVRDKMVPIEKNRDLYKAVGIPLRDFDNPENLVGFDELIRYFHETTPDVINATEEEMSAQLPKYLPRIMTINEFYNISNYKDKILPSESETYQLIAQILVSLDSSMWQPKLLPNNHWSNWESGSL